MTLSHIPHARSQVIPYLLQEKPGVAEDALDVLLLSRDSVEESCRNPGRGHYGLLSVDRWRFRRDMSSIRSSML
jgi:hypothetical protein